MRAPALAEDLRAGVQVVCAKIPAMPELVCAECLALLYDSLCSLFHQFQVAARNLAGPRPG